MSTDTPVVERWITFGKTVQCEDKFYEQTLSE